MRIQLENIYLEKDPYDYGYRVVRESEGKKYSSKVYPMNRNDRKVEVTPDGVFLLERIDKVSRPYYFLVKLDLEMNEVARYKNDVIDFVYDRDGVYVHRTFGDHDSIERLSKNLRRIAKSDLYPNFYYRVLDDVIEVNFIDRNYGTIHLDKKTLKSINF